MLSLKSFIKIFFQKMRLSIYIILYDYFKLTKKIDNKKILFLSDSREDLSGNFKFVYDEVKKYKTKYTINMFFKKSLKSKKKFSEKIKLCHEIATSKYIFLDDFYPIIYGLKLRKDTKLIQLWHAMGAFKRVGYSRGGVKCLTHRGYTTAIVSSENIRKDYAEAFNMNIDDVKALGIPRTDSFFDIKQTKRIKEELYEKYPILKNKKVILFAPTFRGKGQNEAYYDFSWIDFKKFKENFSNDYVCIIKMHPFIKNRSNYNFKDDDFYLDLSSEREINKLLFITDILVTDYSSVIFEYSFFNKPVVFFVPDLEEYKNNRNFYYPFEKYTYGPLAINQIELVKCIKEEKIDKQKLKEFKNYFCSACDGHSTKKTCDFIFKN